MRLSSLTNAQTGSKIAKLQEKGTFYAKQIEVEAKKLVAFFPLNNNYFFPFIRHDRRCSNLFLARFRKTNRDGTKVNRR